MTMCPVLYTAEAHTVSVELDDDVSCVVYSWSTVMARCWWSWVKRTYLTLYRETTVPSLYNSPPHITLVSSRSSLLRFPTEISVYLRNAIYTSDPRCSMVIRQCHHPFHILVRTTLYWNESFRPIYILGNHDPTLSTDCLLMTAGLPSVMCTL